MVRLREGGKLNLGIAQATARVISLNKNLKPTRTTASAAYGLWSTVALGIFLFSIYRSFTAHWWSFIPGLIAFLVIARANENANQSNLLDAAMVDVAFYDKIAARGGWIYQVEPSAAEDLRATPRAA